LLAHEIHLFAPMNLGAELVGLIGAGKCRRQKWPANELVRLLDLLAGESALVIKNACLITDLEETLPKLQLAYRRTIDAQDEERRRLAGDLHDDIPGHLMIMNQIIHSIQRRLATKPVEVGDDLGLLKDQTEYVEHRLREIARGLHPSVLTNLGLISALQAYLDSLPSSSANPKIITLTVQGFNNKRPADQKLERDLYNIARQALDNALEHAQADHIFIHLHWRQDSISLTIQDTGQGLNDKPEVLMGQNGHLGLLSMSERARAWGGHFFIQPNLRGGTTVRAYLPVDQPSPDPAHLQVFPYNLTEPAPSSIPNP
jgi:signal transduction histidine kinase